MTIRKWVNWGFVSLGLASATISLIFLFSSPVFALACSASMNCGGTKLSCECGGAGTCTDGGSCIQCNCNGQTGVKQCCFYE